MFISDVTRSDVNPLTIHMSTILYQRVDWNCRSPNKTLSPTIRLNRQRYLRFILNMLSELLVTNTSCCLRKAVAAHFDIDVRKHLDYRFPNCWIGRDVPFHGQRDRRISFLYIFFPYGDT